MTMLRTKKKKSISDQIQDVLKPRELVEETDDNEARFEEFTENVETSHQLSDIRKQNAKSLSELDSKYKGKVVSRNELDLEDDDESSDEESLNEDNYSESGSDELSGEEENSEEADSSEEDSDENSDEEDVGEDYDLSQFNQSRSDQSTSDVTQDKTELLREKSLNEEIQKGVCVQNQLKIWEKLLEVRIKSQKMLITANALPDFDAHLELVALDSSFSEKVERTCDGLHGLLDGLLELQSTLVSG